MSCCAFKANLKYDIQYVLQNDFLLHHETLALHLEMRTNILYFHGYIEFYFQYDHCQGRITIKKLHDKHLQAT